MGPVRPTASVPGNTERAQVARPMSARFEGVLFDWCGTLVGYPSVETRVAQALVNLGREGAATEVERIATAIIAASELPEAIEADRRCDLSAEDHAATKALIFELAGLDGELAEALERGYGDLSTYEPYPEVVQTITTLVDAGVQVAIVSDFHVDLRPHFGQLGILDLIDGFAISYEVGAIKPDPKMFATALSLLGLAGNRCLMVGDNPHPDCGGAALGITTLILPVPVEPRPPLLDTVVDLVLPARWEREPVVQSG